MQVILEHLTTKFKQYFPDVEVNTVNSFYLQVELNVAHLQDGEYQLTIYDDNNKVVGEETIRLGEHTETKVQYKVEKKFTQYVK